MNINASTEPVCTECKGKCGFTESGCGEGCCPVGVMCEACCGTGLQRVQAAVVQLAGSAEAQPVDQQALLAARAEGRAEAMMIIQSMEPEDALNDCMVGSGPCPATGEYDTHWDDAKLRAKFMVGDNTLNMETKAELAYYEYTEARMVLQYEADQRRYTAPPPQPDSGRDAALLDGIKTLTRYSPSPWAADQGELKPHENGEVYLCADVWNLLAQQGEKGSNHG